MRCKILVLGFLWVSACTSNDDGAEAAAPAASDVAGDDVAAGAGSESGAASGSGSVGSAVDAPAVDVPPSPGVASSPTPDDPSVGSAPGDAAGTPGASSESVAGAVDSAGDDTALDDTALDDTTAADGALDNGALDDGALDDSGLDDSGLDEAALDEAALDDSTADDSALDDAAVDDATAADASLDDSGADDSGQALAAAPGCSSFGQPQQAGSFENPVLSGPSGMVASRQHAGVLYSHLDTGGEASVYATTTDGKELGVYALDGLQQTDWEDIAVGPGPGGSQFIFIGDIGDNAAGGMGGGGNARAEIQVYRIAEPDVALDQAPVSEIVSFETLRFSYPDGAQNAESLMIDPITQDIFIMTKTSNQALVFRAPGDAPVDNPTVLEQVAQVSVGASTAAAGDISANGDRILVRTYQSLLLWPRAAGSSIAEAFEVEPIELPAPDEPRSEGVTFSADGSAWYSTGEEDNAIYTAECQ